MDATTRWETEALRDGTGRRPAPPTPSGKRQREPDRHWATLREAEAATGIPANTLRKWARKSSIPSYLESDGEMAVRLVDLEAVIDHARQLGREISVSDDAAADEEPVDAGPRAGTPAKEAPAAEAGSTMIVPVDAWNKMLAQLGNLHEAGQQLAEARERAAKAETEVTFLRQRLAELRTETVPTREAVVPDDTTEATPGEKVEPAPPEPRTTTTYWRYLTSGWRSRRRRERGS
jgi:hypothetical protein